MSRWLAFKFLCLVIGVINCDTRLSVDEEAASKFATKVCEEMKSKMYEANVASWNYASNLTDANQKLKEESDYRMAIYNSEIAKEIRQYDIDSFRNATLKRLMQKISSMVIGDNMLDERDFHDLVAAVAHMQTNFAKVRIEKYNGKGQFVSLEPEITEVLQRGRDPAELEYYWTKFYDMAGTPSKNDFFKYVELRNKAAKLNQRESGADLWLEDYEDENFEKQIEDILKQLEPFYKQLHGYVRHKLREFYGAQHVDTKKPIPMHLLGNMWGQLWEIEDIVIPYKNASRIEFTQELINQNYTPRKMFETAEEFFGSIDMSPMPETFWRKSIIEKPKDRDIICHASAWDFTIDDDVRIKMCTRVSMESFITIHHEMGHVEYYLQYRHQPLPFRAGANHGFHEAVGDTISLSVASAKHLNRIGLLAQATHDTDSQINQLLSVALRKLALLPFAYVMDKFRYEIFRGTIPPETANCHFWRLREKYGGIAPASVRGDHDFDITAKYHVSADVEYMRYFVSNIIQFQFHKAACIKAGEYAVGSQNSLSNCDIYQSAEAGRAFKEMLSLGSSLPWQDALERLTGERRLDASAFLEYFQPLQQWLEKTNKQLGVHIGWELSDKIDCPKLYD